MNGICHIEIPSHDFEKARKFYGGLFKWQFDYMKEMDYLMFKAPDGINGGFSKELAISEKAGIFLYIEVEDIETTIKNGEEVGGKTVKGKAMIGPEIGYFAILADLEGNQIGLWAKN